MKQKNLFYFYVILIFLSSCKLQPFETDKPQIMTEDTGINEETSLFIKNNNSNSYVFQTNDIKYLSSKGFTLWSASFINESEDFETLSFKTYKESGKSDAGYGIVFCIQETDGVPFMLTVLINTKGMFSVGKVKNGVYSHINEGWKSSDCINRGYGVNNTISISYDNNRNEFEISINGTVISTFTISENILFKNSKSGFAVVIAPDEDFPAVPVKVTFER
jgi:hypothetical protein